jgi:peptidoglycan/LPS O-acetylase OafA/YrhL
MTTQPPVANNFYRSDIDGLRCMAVLPVLLYHLHYQFLPGGYLGVDVFFVISGFLITMLLIKENPSGISGFARFWMRRIKRLFPVACVVLVASISFGYFVLFSNEWIELSRQGLAMFTFSSNFYFWRTAHNYWGMAAESMPLLHTWSLAVEEQFYLLFPPALFILQKYCLHRLNLVLLLAVVSSFFIALIGFTFHPVSSFYLLPTRVWELLLGCSLGAITVFRGFGFSRHHNLLAFAGLVAIFCAYTIHPETEYSLLNATVATAGTGLVLAFGRPNSGGADRILSVPSVVLIGKLSYSLYLWHWPVIVFGRLIGVYQPVILLTVSLALAAISFFAIERPTRHMPTVRFTPILGMGLLAIIISLSVPTLIISQPEAHDSPQYLSSLSLDPTNPDPHFEGLHGNYRDGLILSDSERSLPLDVLLVGDSHSMMFFPAVHSICRSLGLSLGFYGSGGGASPFFVQEDNPRRFYADEKVWTPEQRLEFDSCRIRFVNHYKPKLIIICARWDYHHDHLGPQLFQTHLNDWEKTTPNSHLLYLGQPPVLPFGEAGFAEDILNLPPLRKLTESSPITERRHAAHAILKAYCGTGPHTTFIETEAPFLSGSQIIYSQNGTLLYWDDDHLSTQGSEKVVPILATAIQSILSK